MLARLPGLPMCGYELHMEHHGIFNSILSPAPYFSFFAAWEHVHICCEGFSLLHEYSSPAAELSSSEWSTLILLLFHKIFFPLHLYSSVQKEKIEFVWFHNWSCGSCLKASTLAIYTCYLFPVKNLLP